MSMPESEQADVAATRRGAHVSRRGLWSQNWRRIVLRGRFFHTLLWLFAVLPPLAMFVFYGRWGLPSKANDDLLFGGDPAWSAERLNAGRLEQSRRERSGGADTDLDPIADRSRIVDLTETEAQRAAILVRYRLYSHQPDEMITLMALSRMNPRQGDFDPRLYQYGGAWIYLAGAALALMKPLLGLQFSLAANLDQPEKFGLFYVVLRGVTMLFTIGLILVCQRILLRAGKRVGALFVAPLLLTTPVVMSCALEAKPHLPSVCMTMAACAAALGFLRRPSAEKAGWLAFTGGASLGLVLTGAAAGAVWPALVAVDRRTRNKRAIMLLIAAGIGALVIYAATNPYPIYNWLFRPAVLASNVGNSTAMYRVGRFGAGALRVGELLVESCGWATLLIGAVGLAFLTWRRPRESAIIGAPALAMLFLTIAIGADKPAEFARFLLLPACVLTIGVAYFLARIRWFDSSVVILLLLLSGSQSYWRAFWNDGNGYADSRRATADFINSMNPNLRSMVQRGGLSLSDDELAILARAMEQTHGSVGVIEEPAPYSVPPIDFTRWRVVLLPSERPPGGVDPATLPWIVVYTADDARADRDEWWRSHYKLLRTYPSDGRVHARITWANKPMFVLMRIDDPNHVIDLSP